ncbi:hypothetical protein H0H93_006216, partial [Arthromyces matolae]
NATHDTFQNPKHSNLPVSTTPPTIQKQALDSVLDPVHVLVANSQAQKRRRSLL